MTYAIGIYAIGLCLLLIGFLFARPYEQSAAKITPTIIAYVFWPLTVVAVIAAALWRRFGRADVIGAAHQFLKLVTR